MAAEELPALPFAEGQALSGARYSAVELGEGGACVYLLDQLRLPALERYRVVRDAAGVAEAIRSMVVRGAPAIGIAAAYGMALGARAAAGAPAEQYVAALRAAGSALVATRPTAVNLAWAVRRMIALAEEHAGAGSRRATEMAELARAIHREDVAACRAIGRVGARSMAGVQSVLTHCNAGALATGGYGTALGVVRAAHEASPALRVLSCETRPFLQGARLTAWELARDGIDVTVIADAMAGHCMQRGMIDAVVVGADRIARNGDVANKIGTYGIACLARAHGVPFYVAAPWSSIDLETPTGADIVIEERPPHELVIFGAEVLAPAEARVYNPAFDVTPAALVTGIFTERGAFAAGELAPAGGAIGAGRAGDPVLR
jgi:methylthioribose-1-phosphate isomerase